MSQNRLKSMSRRAPRVLPTVHADVQVDESWLMSAEELDQFEKGFEEVDG